MFHVFLFLFLPGGAKANGRVGCNLGLFGLGLRVWQHVEGDGTGSYPISAGLEQ